MRNEDKIKTESFRGCVDRGAVKVVDIVCGACHNAVEYKLIPADEKRRDHQFLNDVQELCRKYMKGGSR